MLLALLQTTTHQFVSDKCKMAEARKKKKIYNKMNDSTFLCRLSISANCINSIEMRKRKSQTIYCVAVHEMKNKQQKNEENKLEICALLFDNAAATQRGARDSLYFCNRINLPQ